MNKQLCIADSLFEIGIVDVHDSGLVLHGLDSLLNVNAHVF
jgi:hypothetical protein